MRGMGVITLGMNWPQGVHWDAPWAFALLVVPLLMLVWRGRARKSAVVLPIAELAGSPPRSMRQRLLWLPRVLKAAGVAALVLALARPQLGEGRVLSSTESVAIQVLVDRSGSMGREMELGGSMLTRIDCVKRVLHDFLVGNSKDLAGRSNDLVGLVTFARFAETSCPMVRDPAAIVHLVDQVQPAMQRYEDGTAIGDGIALAAARLKTAEDDLKSRRGLDQGDDFKIKSKVIVLLTDGENNCGEHDPIEAAKLAADWGIKVYTIGIGGGGYETVRTFAGLQRVPMEDEVDEKMLKRIAEITGAVFFRARDGDALQHVYSEIDRLERSKVQTVDYVEYKELFAPLAAGACALLALQLMLGATWLRRVPA